MSLLDDARRLATSDVSEDGTGACTFGCGDGFSVHDGTVHHGGDCLWLAMPMIVRALEAADRIVDADPLVADFCFACSDYNHRHYDDCIWVALRSALRLPTVTPELTTGTRAP